MVTPPALLALEDRVIRLDRLEPQPRVIHLVQHAELRVAAGLEPPVGSPLRNSQHFSSTISGLAWLPSAASSRPT